MSTDSDFTLYLKQALTERKLKTNDFAKMIGSSVSHAHNLVNGSRQPTLQMINTIAKALDLPEWEVLLAAGMIDQRACDLPHEINDLIEQDTDFRTMLNKLVSLPPSLRSVLVGRMLFAIDVIKALEGSK